MQKFSKKLFSLLLILSSLVLILVGCGASTGTSDSSDPSDSDDTATTSDSGEEVELNVMTWDSVQEPGVQAAIDAYMEANPNITVNLETIPNHEDMVVNLESSMEAGEGPDVFWLGGQILSNADSGAIEPLNEWIENDDLDMSIYNDAIIENHNIDGQQYGIPKDMDAWFIIYNKAIFDEHGVDYPSEGWTWDDLVSISNELNENMDDNQYPFYFDTIVNYGLGTLMNQHGDGFVDDQGNSVAGEEATVTSLNQLYDLQENGLMPHVVDNPDYDPISSLISGNLAMSTVPSWNIPAIVEAASEDLEFAAVAFPENNGSNITDTSGLSYCMNADSENKEEAWELLKFLTSDEGAQAHALNGAGLPANDNEDIKNAWVESNSAIENIDVVNAITSENYLRETTAYPQIRDGISEFSENAYLSYFAGEISAEEAAASLDELLSELLD